MKGSLWEAGACVCVRVRKAWCWLYEGSLKQSRCSLRGMGYAYVQHSISLIIRHHLSSTVSEDEERGGERKEEEGEGDAEAEG